MPATKITEPSESIQQTADAIKALAESAKIAPDLAAVIVEEVEGDLETTRVSEVDEEKALLEKFVRLNARYDAEITRVKEQQRAYLAELEAKRTRIWQVLGMRAEAITKKLIAGGKAKSVKLAFGTVGFRTKPAGLDVFNEEVLLAWADANGEFELVRVKKELSKTALNDRFKNGGAGELPPGCQYVPASETFYVK